MLAEREKEASEFLRRTGTISSPVMAAIGNAPFDSSLTSGMVTLSHSLHAFRHSRNVFPFLCIMELKTTKTVSEMLTRRDGG